MREQDYFDEKDMKFILSEVETFLQTWSPDTNYGSTMAYDFVRLAFTAANPQDVAAHLVMEYKIRKGLDVLKED